MRFDRTTDFDFGDGGYSAMADCHVAAAVVGGSVVSGLMGSMAAGDAADTQAAAADRAAASTTAATDRANQLNWSMYQQQLANNAPGMQAGQTALSSLMGGLGLGQLRATQAGTQAPMPGSSQGPTGPTFTNPQGQNVDQYGMPVAAQGTTQNYGATQGELNSANGLLPSGSLLTSFSDSVKANGGFEADPSYQWRLAQGQKALEASAAARGSLFTGQNLADITNYGQGAASQEFAAANDRYNTNQGNIFSRLAGIAGIGQTATAANNAAASGVGSTIGGQVIAGNTAANNYTTTGAAAQAAGTIGSANAWGSAINNGLGNYTTLQYLNQGKSPYRDAPATATAG